MENKKKNQNHFKFLFIKVQGSYAFNNRFLVCNSFCFVLFCFIIKITTSRTLKYIMKDLYIH